MNPLHGKYAALTAAIVMMNCNPSVQQTEVKKPEPAAKYDCSSLDLTKKAGFSTSFVANGEKFCYHIKSREEHYYEGMGNCDAKGMPLPGSATIIREFAGPEKGYTQLNLVLEVNGDYLELPFFREPSGEISTLPTLPENLEQLFTGNIGLLFIVGERRLDQARDLPQLCKELLEYQP